MRAVPKQLPTTPREGGGCVWCVCVCVRTLTSNALVGLKKVHGVYNRNIRGETAESIISDITTLTYQMTICTSKASELLRVAAREAWAHTCIYFWVSASEHLVQTGTGPNLKRRGKCLNSQWKEVGREWRGKTGERQKGRMASRSMWDNSGHKNSSALSQVWHSRNHKLGWPGFNWGTKSATNAGRITFISVCL